MRECSIVDVQAAKNGCGILLEALKTGDEVNQNYAVGIVQKAELRLPLHMLVALNKGEILAKRSLLCHSDQFMKVGPDARVGELRDSPIPGIPHNCELEIVAKYLPANLLPDLTGEKVL
jgi:hypothetical protein